MRLILTTISPIHIGSGEIFTSLEYIIEGNYVYIIDLQKLSNALPTSYLKEKQEDLRSQVGISKIIKEKRLTPQNISSKRINTATSLPHGAEIHEFIKLPIDYKCYIPGSSLKGAIRTAILWMKLKDELSQKTNLDVAKIKQLDDDTFGKFNNSAMAFLHLSDSFNSVDGRIMEIKIASPSPESSQMRWKSSGSKVESIQDATSLFYECIDIEQNFEFEIAVPDSNASLLKKMKANNLNNKIPLTSIKTIINSCNLFSKYQIEQEVKYFAKYNLINSPVARFYTETIVPAFNSLKNNQCMVHMSWGAGWLSKTFTSIVRDTNEDFFNKNKTKFGDVKNIDAKFFPKSRRFIVQNNAPLYPLGWAKMEFDTDKIEGIEKVVIEQNINTIKSVPSSTMHQTATQSFGDIINQAVDKKMKKLINKGDIVEARIIKIAGQMAEVEILQKFDNLKSQRFKDVRLFYNHSFKQGAKVKLKVERFLKDIPVFKIKEGE